MNLNDDFHLLQMLVESLETRCVFFLEVTQKCLSTADEIFQVPMLDKSCSVEEEMVNPDGLSFLQKCFPSVDESDLQDVLTRCEGDLQWATNILLDSSLEYNKPVSSDKNYSTADAKNQTVKRSPTGESPGASGNISSPPLLAVLCHSSLPPATELSSNNVQQTFYHGSVQRLKSIEEFKRQHSTPSESYDKGAEVVVDRQPDLSMVNPCSPGGTLKDDVFETLFSQKSTKKFIPPTFKRIASLSPSPEDARSSADAEPSVSPAGQDEIDGKPVEPNATAAVSASIVTPIDEVIEGELKEVTTDFDVSLELPHALAKQLIKMFGPVAFHISPGIFWSLTKCKIMSHVKCYPVIMEVCVILFFTRVPVSRRLDYPSE